MLAFSSGDGICWLQQIPARFSICKEYTTSSKCSLCLCGQVSLWTEEFRATAFKIQPQKMSHYRLLTLEQALAKLDEDFKVFEEEYMDPRTGDNVCMNEDADNSAMTFFLPNWLHSQ